MGPLAGQQDEPGRTAVAGREAPEGRGRQTRDVPSGGSGRREPGIPGEPGMAGEAVSAGRPGALRSLPRSICPPERSACFRPSPRVRRLSAPSPAPGTPTPPEVPSGGRAGCGAGAHQLRAP
ncbi:cuticle collagen 7-like [Pan paniscus]|uniref:cuticle collagen 7-like n=1 Tax=Pan paniscus TaxID=9597 RepID=UPI00243640C5|nr:cuticle collagen 7-like [Pan paniscus]